MNATKWIGLGVILVNLGVAACSGDDDDDNDTAGTGGTAGHGGAGAKGGSAGKATGGTGVGGDSGAPGRGGTAGRGGSGGSAGTAAGRGGSSAGIGGAAGESGASGEAGSGGEGGEAVVRLRDAQIVQIALVANQGEVTEGGIAVMRASSDAVRDFAQMMVEHHSAAADEAMTLKDVIGVESNEVSNTLQLQTMATVGALNDASDDEFDAVYMDSQVKAHEEVLAIVRSTLIPQADNDDLKELLSNMETTVEQHLDEARDVRDAL